MPGPLVFSPDEVLQQLQGTPEAERGYAAERLLKALQLQKEVLLGIRRATADDGEAPLTLQDADRLLLLYLQNIFLIASTLPEALRFHAMQALVASSGLAAPFVSSFSPEQGRLVLGVPSTDAPLDSISELTRVAAAATVGLFHYTNYPQTPGLFPTDDASLLFTTMAVDACTEAGTAAAMQAQVEELVGQEQATAFGVSQIRWLMHFVRSELCGHFAQVSIVMNDMLKAKENYTAAQHDSLGLIKSLPEVPLGFLRYCRCCLALNHTTPAALFASKGLTVAQRHGAHAVSAQLHAVHAVAVAIGGGPGGTFSPAAVSAEIEGIEGSLQAARAGLPEIYHSMLVVPEPEQSLLAPEGLIQAGLEDLGRDTDGLVPALPITFTVPRPSAIPIGATIKEDGGEPAAETTSAAGAGTGTAAGPAGTAAARAKPPSRAKAAAGAKAKPSADSK